MAATGNGRQRRCEGRVRTGACPEYAAGSPADEWRVYRWYRPVSRCPSPVATPRTPSCCRASISGRRIGSSRSSRRRGGKLKAIAKGIRRPTSRIGGSLEPFAELNVALARGRTFDVVTQVSVGHAWLRLRDDLESAATAWYLAELADRSLEERHAAEPLYTLLRRAYELLDAGMAPGRVARWFEMHLLDELGVRPEVDRCVECDRVLESDERFRWVPPQGGIVCERCPGPSHDRAGLSLEALKLLKAYQRLDIEALAGLRLSNAVEGEVETALRDFVRHVLEREARSLAFLDEVRAAT